MTGFVWRPLQLAPIYKDYVWGGKRLRPGIAPTAEAWVIHEEGTILTQPFPGITLRELAAAYPEQILGRLPVERTGAKFPLLIKLLDSADWLSLQVHPNDDQAKQLEGEGYFGKTEAWHVIEAEPEAHIIAGFQPGTDPDGIRLAIQQGNLLDYTQKLAVKEGETLFIQPGTLHSIGPGLLLYEVQQSSDLTYRVWDWGRPQTGGRILHIEKSLQVVDPTLHPQMIPLPELKDGEQRVLCSNPYFSLSMLVTHQNRIDLDTRAESFHVLTALDKTAYIHTPGGAVELKRFDTVLIPAALGEYEVYSFTGLGKILLTQVASHG